MFPRGLPDAGPKFTNSTYRKPVSAPVPDIMFGYMINESNSVFVVR